MKNTRTEAEINNDIKTVSEKITAYANLYNEGARDGYNPHIAELEALTDELHTARNGKWTREYIESERAWAKAQGFNDAAAANTACLARGYSLAELNAKIKTL